MRKAMVQALLGDDVYGEDQTINDLEERYFFEIVTFEQTEKRSS